MSVPELTPIEKRIVLSIAEGGLTEEVAAELGVAVRTVEWHLARARRKLARASVLHERVEQATHGAATQGGRQ